MSFLQWLSHLEADFVCIQELHITTCVECDLWFLASGFSVVASPGTLHSCSSAILYQPSFSLSKSCIDSGGRFVLAHFNRDDVTFGLACAYAPNRNPDRNEFLDYCIEQVDVAVPTVICGDFNCVFDRSLDRRGSVASDTSRERTTALKKLFAECCVYDVWHSLHPTSSVITWLRPDGSVSSRIDLIGCPSLGTIVLTLAISSLVCTRIIWQFFFIVMSQLPCLVAEDAGN